MSDLIDFESPNSKNVGLLLASPLIPAPKTIQEGSSNPSETGSHFSLSRRSVENNPFDMIMKKVTEYEINKEDPFERVIEKAMRSDENEISRSNDREQIKCTSVAKICNATDETEENSKEAELEKNDLVHEDNDMSIITDLNNTNLIGDHVDRRSSDVFWKCDNKLPVINFVPSPCDNDLSILNNSAMNDSLLDCNNKVTKNTQANCTIQRRSLSQNDDTSISKLLTQSASRRTLSLTDSSKNSIFGENSTISMCQSNTSENLLNNAFLKTNLKNCDSSCLSSQLSLFNISKVPRLNSDSSVFEPSTLSNLSAIPMDTSNKIRHERFCSESSAISGLSNLSKISSNGMSVSDLSVFSSDTFNKGFVTSRSELNLDNLSKIENSSHKSNKSDLIKKFFEIKKRMSSQTEVSKTEDSIELLKEKDQLPKSHGSEKEDCKKNSVEKLVDINSSSSSVFSDESSVNYIIAHEAKTLAETFEKMASCKESNSASDDDFFLKTQLNFDELPPSDDEVVDNLIELPTSPVKNVEQKKIEDSDDNLNDVPLKIHPKILESEFIEQNETNKKATATKLLLDLQKIISKENNPDAYKVLKDLQKVLGVECDNNNKSVQECYLNLNNSSGNQKQHETKLDLEKKVFNEDSNKSLINPQKNPDKDFISKTNESKKEFLENTKNESQINTQLETKENIEVKSENVFEDQKLTVNLLGTLNKIVNKKNEDDVVDFLSSLSSILSMATELQTKSKEIETTKCDKKIVKNLDRSLNLSFKASSLKNLSGKQQNKSFDVSPQRKSLMNNRSIHSNNLNTLHTKDKRKSDLLNMRRFPSDPEITSKKKNENLKVKDKKSNFLPNNAVSGSIQTKLKKSCSEGVTKKGPLKAMIPLSNMQKQASFPQKMSSHNGTVTPPKSNSIYLTIPSSTPNSNNVYKISKSNPKASSTPNMEDVQHHKSCSQKKSKGTAVNNLSSVSLNGTLKERMNILKNNKRLDRTLSPQKKPQTPKKNSPTNSESRLPRYSPRPMRIRNYSFNDLRTTVKSPTKIASKISSDKNIQRHLISSSLKNLNKVQLGKPTNLISRLRRSNSFQTGSEKENYA